MAIPNTYQLAKTFLESIIDNNETLIRNTYRSSLNSLAAVLAANTSNHLNGQQIKIQEFMHADQYAPYRTRPKNP